LNIQIKIVCAESYKTIIYSVKKIGNHFVVINSKKAFLGSSYYCDKCDKTYNNKDKYKFRTHNYVCKLCKKQHSEEEINKIYCKVYNRYFLQGGL